MPETLSNFEFAQRRVAAERLHYKRSLADATVRATLADPYNELSEEDLVALKALLHYSTDESEADEPQLRRR